MGLSKRGLKCEDLVHPSPPKNEVSLVNLCLEILDLEDGYNWGRLVG